jgi:putative ABC transport system permease protein
MSKPAQPNARATKHTHPPALATQLLLMFLKPELEEEVTGDLDESFKADLRRTSVFRARLRYWIQVMQYMRPFAIRGMNIDHITPNGMFRNYWKVTWRVMARQKLYSSINIGGFAVGIAACLLITLYVQHELSYDTHYQNDDRIYRIYRESTFNGEFHANAWMPAPLVDVLAQYPDIEQAGHYVPVDGLADGRSEMKRVDQQENFYEDRIVYASQGLVDVLELPFVSGKPSTSLTEPHTVVITKRKAEQYFPNEDPLGKALVLNHDEKDPFTVNGVIEDYAPNVHFNADFLLSTKGHEFWEGEQQSWGSSNYFDYVRVRQGTNIAELEQKLHALIETYFVPDAIKFGNDASVDWARSLKFRFQPIADVHLNRMAVRDSTPHGDIKYIWIFSAIAFFIIVIASINFVNLSTARSAKRAKEVGLRKVVGSVRMALVKQFLTESIVYCFVSFLIGYALAYLLLPFFNSVVGTTLTFSGQPLTMLSMLLATALGIGLVAGIYPALYLSSFKPAQILKGTLTKGRGHSALRSTLVVCQYTISIALIIATLVVKDQMSFMLNKKLGFDKDQVLVLQSTHTLGEKMPAFRNELERITGVRNVSVSGFLPVEDARRNGSGMWKGVKGATVDGIDTQQWTVDEGYLATLGLKLIQGRNFSSSLASDSSAAIVNQALLKSMNIKNAIGQTIVNPWRTYTIVGVVEDFHFESMRRDIAPVALLFGENRGAVSVKLETANVQATLSQVTALWKKYVPEQPMRYTFLDQRYALMYADVERMGTIMTGFTGLAILVASLGLFALSAFTVEQRTKEISIRIVLGASVRSIVNLLTGNFMRLVCISFLLAAPIAWFVMRRWLLNYAYRVEVGWQVFVSASLLAFVIAMVTISVQAVRAAMASPGEALRAE